MTYNMQTLRGSALVGRVRSVLALRSTERDQVQWHDELGKITTSLDQLALDTEDNNSALLDRLRRPTDIYLKKTKRKSQSVDDQEDRLITLVKEHDDKPVALLSCAHGLTRLTVRSLLVSELGVDPAQDPSILRYLGVIAVLQYINPSAVSKSEAQRARSLILLLERIPGTFLHNLREFFSTDDPATLYDLFPHGSLDALLERFCDDFVARLEVFKEQCRWEAAYSAVSSLQSTYGFSQALDVCLNRTFRNRIAWKLWAPAHHRILGRDTLSVEHRNQLLDVLMLDGPDFLYERHESLLHALLHQATGQGLDRLSYGRFSVSLGPGSGIDSCKFLKRILDFPCGRRLTTPCAIDLFIYLSIHNTADGNTLVILKEAASLREPQVYQWLLDIFVPSTHTVRTLTFIKLVKVLHAKGNHSLLDGLSGYIKDAVQEDFVNLQKMLIDLIENQSQRNPQPTGFQLQRLGQSFKHSLVMFNTLDQQVQQLLQHWPSEEEVDALFELHTEVLHGKISGSLGTLIPKYCLIRLAGRTPLDAPAQHAIDALLWHWREKLDVPKRTLALTITSSTILPLDVQTECLLHIRDMDFDYLKDLNIILSSRSERACSRLATLICSRHFLRHHDQRCWKKVLSMMLEQRKSTLVDYMASQMKVGAWFAWLEQLRDLFDIHDASFTRGRPFLHPQLHSWSQELHSKYLAVLCRLETKHETQILVQSSLKEWQFRSLITKVLDCLLDDSRVDQRRLILEEATRVKQQGTNFDGPAWAKLSALASTRT